MPRGLMGGRRPVPEFWGPATPLRTNFTYAAPDMFAHHPEASLPAHVATGAGQAKRFFVRGDGKGLAKPLSIRGDGEGQAKRLSSRGDGEGQGVGALADARPLDPLPVPTGIGEKEEG